MLDAWLSNGWALYTYARREVTWQAVVIYGGILLLSWLVSKLFVLPYVSPLRKIPGRPTGSLLFGCLPEILRKEAIDPYNDWVKEMKTGIIRYRHLFGSQRVLVADADAAKHVLVTNARNYPRPVFLFGIFTRIVGRSLLTLEGHDHFVQRRLCNTAFRLPCLQALLPTFQKHTEKLCEQWRLAVKNQTEGPTLVEIQSTLASLTFDIISESGFGHESHAVSDPNDAVAKAFNYILQPRGNRLLRIMLPTLSRLLPTEANRQFETNLRLLHSRIQDIIEAKRKAMSSKSGGDKSSPPDLLERLLLAEDMEEGVGLSAYQLQSHVMTFMLAGHETTASTLSWILLTLAQQPNIQHKARQEVMSVLPPSGQPITFEDLEKLTYLTCVIKEALRLFPPAPLVMREAAQDDTICGYPIPKGTVVNVSVGALHRNPAYWEKPEEFIPERFQDESSVPFYAYQPFISGPHMCIGHRFALLELKMSLSILLRQFEFSPLADVSYRKRQMITMRPNPPLKLHIRCLQS